MKISLLLFRNKQNKKQNPQIDENYLVHKTIIPKYEDYETKQKNEENVRGHDIKITNKLKKRERERKIERKNNEKEQATQFDFL